MNKLVNRETIAYLIFGVFTTFVYFFTRFMVLKLTNDSLFSVISAQCSAILFAYITNKIYVFKDNEWRITYVLKQLTTFIAGRLLVFFLDVLITYVAIVKFSYVFINLLLLNKINYNLFLFNNNLTKNFIGSPDLLNEFIFALLVQVLAVILNYIISKKAIFKNK